MATKTKRENWGGKYVNVTRDDRGRIKTWAKWSVKNRPADKAYTSAGFARRNYARGIADRLELQEVTRGSVNKQKRELNEYSLTIEIEGSKSGKRSPARIKEIRLATEDELDENALYETLRRLAREDDGAARWVERFDEIVSFTGGAKKLRSVFNAGKTTSGVRGVSFK